MPMLIAWGFGGVPVNVTRPAISPAVAGSTCLPPPAGGGAAADLGAELHALTSATVATAEAARRKNRVKVPCIKGMKTNGWYVPARTARAVLNESACGSKLHYPRLDPSRATMLALRVPTRTPVSSRGQDTWFSATGPGFDSPYRYQPPPNARCARGYGWQASIVFSLGAAHVAASGEVRAEVVPRSRERRECSAAGDVSAKRSLRSRLRLASQHRLFAWRSACRRVRRGPGGGCRAAGKRLASCPIMSTRSVYILKNSEVPPRYYTGIARNVAARCEEHNKGRSIHTAKYGPWTVDVVIEFADETRAVAFERYLKSGAGLAFAQRHFR